MITNIAAHNNPGDPSNTKLITDYQMPTNKMAIATFAITTRIEDIEDQNPNENSSCPVTANFHPANSDTEYLIDPESSVGMLILKPRHDRNSRAASTGKTSSRNFVAADNMPL